VPLPTLSPEQRAAALEKAAEIRKARAELKEKLKAGKTTLGKVLDQARRQFPGERLQRGPVACEIRVRELQEISARDEPAEGGTRFVGLGARGEAQRGDGEGGEKSTRDRPASG